MSGQGFAAGLIRFASVVPFFSLGISGVSLYTNARKLEVLSTKSQGRRCLQGLAIAGIMVCTGSISPQMYLTTRAYLALGYHWLRLECINPFTND